MSQKLLSRLTQQVSGKGVSDPKKLAAAILTKRGQMKDKKLTPSGLARQKLGAKGRSLSRSSKYSGRPESDFTYSSKTNRSKLKSVKK